MQSYTPLVPITGIKEEFCFCFLLVAGLILHFNGRCSEIIRAAADEPRGWFAAAAVWHGQSTFPAPQYLPSPRWLKATCHIACILEKEGKKEKWFLLPTAELSWGHLRVTEWGGGYPSGAAGPVGISTAASLPGVLSAAEAAGKEGGNAAGRLQRLPPGPSAPSSPAPGANAPLRAEETQICAAASPPSLQRPEKKMVNVILHQIGL